jgi:hypothetical protein
MSYMTGYCAARPTRSIRLPCFLSRTIKQFNPQYPLPTSGMLVAICPFDGTKALECFLPEMKSDDAS